MGKLIPYTIAWSALAIVVVALAVRRKMVSSKEDDMLHLGADSTAIANQQLMVAKRLESIDKWGKSLTIVLALTGLVLAAFYGLALWEESSRWGLK